MSRRALRELQAISENGRRRPHASLLVEFFEDKPDRYAAKSDISENGVMRLSTHPLLAQKVDECAQLGRQLRAPRRIQIETRK